MGFWIFRLRLTARVLVASCAIAIFSLSSHAGPFPLGRSESPVVLPYSYYGKDHSGGELSAVFDPKGSRGSIALKAGGSHIEIATSPSFQTLSVSRQDKAFRYIFIFNRSLRIARFDLVAIKRQKLERLFSSSPTNSGLMDLQSFDLVEGAKPRFAPSSSLCVDEMSASTQIQGLKDSIMEKESCRSPLIDSNALASLARNHAPEGSLNMNSPIACLEGIGTKSSFGFYKPVANKLRGKFVVADNMKVRCDANAKSNFDERGDGALTIGREILTGSTRERGRVLFHEMLHSVGIRDESEMNSLVECCAFPKGDESQCRLADWFAQLNDAELRSVEGRDKHWEIMGELLRDERAPASEKIKKADELNHAFVCFTPSASGGSSRGEAKCDKTGDAEDFYAKAKEICSLVKTPSCSSKLELFKKYLESQTGMMIGNNVTQTYWGRVTSPDHLATAPADPNAKPQTSPQQAVPQVLQYRAETTEPAAVRREVEKIRQPLMAAREYGGSVARTIVAGMGNAAYAANSSLPRQVSKTEWTSAVKSVDPKTGRVTLDLGRDERGRQIIASASIPFDGSQFGPPQVSVQTENSPILSDRTTANRKLNASASARVDVSESTYKSATEVGSSIPGRLPRSVGTTKTQSAKAVESEGVSGGAGASGSNLSSGGSSGASRSRSPSRSIADAPSVSASVLKRMLVRTEAPDVIIRDHIEDFKANSMQVRYKCVWYPQNFKGTQLFDLDAYQGRKCGPQ